jgi:hypothetical protein
MTRSILLSVSRDCSVVAETSLRGDGGTLDRGRTGIILGAEGGMAPLMLGGKTPFCGGGKLMVQQQKFQSGRCHLEISKHSDWNS